MIGRLQAFALAFSIVAVLVSIESIRVQSERLSALALLLGLAALAVAVVARLRASR